MGKETNEKQNKQKIQVFFNKGSLQKYLLRP